MTSRININADLGESFGAYEIGDDLALLSIVKTANIACGMHGGDPSVMRRTLAEAARRGVSVGAHPGFNDLWGFGRRPIRMSAADLEYLVAYQIGALQALAAYESQPLTHVKAHGALYLMACEDADYAAALARAVKTVAPDLIHLVMPGTALETASRQLGLRVAREGYADRSYEASGLLTPRSAPGAVISDPDEIRRRVARIATEGVVSTRQGPTIPLEVDTLCVHGDQPSAIAAAEATRAALLEAGLLIEPLPAVLACSE